MPRRKFLQYCWDTGVAPQIGYSFSSPHTIAYSIEAVQEANLATRFSPLFWQCACLSVDSGASDTSMDEDYAEDYGDEEEGRETEEEKANKAAGVDYGKISRAVAEAQLQGAKIAPPNVNLAERDFMPDIEENAILFSLKAVTSVNDELISKIIANRPFSSMEDFIQKVSPTNLQMINLIKAGGFDSFYPGKFRQYIMNVYLKYYAESKVTKKEKLTMANYFKALQQGIIPDKFELARRATAYKAWIDSNEQEADKKRYVIVNESSKRFFETHLKHLLTLGKQYDTVPNGYAVKISSMKKAIDSLLEELKVWLTSEEATDAFYKGEIKAVITEQMQKYCQGSVSKWEMNSAHYYSKEHELKGLNTVFYDIKNFNDLPEQPIIKGTNTLKDGRVFPVYDLCTIAGTVINADNNKHIVTLLTNYGNVVDVKFFKNAYIEYNKAISQLNDKDKKEIVEKSWFERGALLLISGFRRENSFIPKRDWRNGIPYDVQLITGFAENGRVFTKTEREKVK